MTRGLAVTILITAGLTIFSVAEALLAAWRERSMPVASARSVTDRHVSRPPRAEVTVYAARQVRAEVRAALASAEAIIAEHHAYGNGLCTCLRLLPCPVETRAELYAQHWRTRVDYYTTIAGPTLADMHRDELLRRKAVHRVHMARQMRTCPLQQVNR